MQHLIVINTQSFGDILLSTHVARLAKKYCPDTLVHFYINPNITLTTAEHDPEARMDMLRILFNQENIYSVGFFMNDRIYSHFCKDQVMKPMTDYKTLLIQGWSSDLGIVKSQLKPFYDLYGITDEIDTETEFNVGGLMYKDITGRKLTVGLAGEQDFLRKWHNKQEYEKLLAMVRDTKYNIDIERFGVDVENTPYSRQLARLQKCDLLISPIGSLVHCAAGLGIDTISLTSVFPVEYDCPEVYHSGWHKSIKVKYPRHCGTFKCVTNKPYDNQSSWGNPATEFGFWPSVCPYTVNGGSCNYNITAAHIIEKFDEWYNEKSKI